MSRNDYECGHYLEYVFVFLDVRFISVELPALDSYLRPNEISSIATKMQSYMNDQHCYQTSMKIRSVFDMKRSMGQFIGAFAPYGYLKDPEDYHKLVINPETAPVIQNIFKWYVYEGMNKCDCKAFDCVRYSKPDRLQTAVRDELSQSPCTDRQGVLE